MPGRTAGPARLEPNLSLPQVEQSFAWTEGACLICTGFHRTQVTSLGTLPTVLGPLVVSVCKWCLAYRIQDIIRDQSAPAAGTTT